MAPTTSRRIGSISSDGEIDPGAAESDEEAGGGGAAAVRMEVL
jgi:hypothetical protein